MKPTLARQGIYLLGFLKSDVGVELVGQERRVWGWVESGRRKIRQLIEATLPHRQAGLLKALLVGDRGGLDRDVQERFVIAGVAHLLSISGLHVGMLGLVVFALVRFLGSRSTSLMLRWNLLKWATLVSLIAVLLYAVLAGARTPHGTDSDHVWGLRMAVLLDREAEVFRSLALAALLISLLWPGVSVEPSFQLSFVAVLAIVWGLQKIRDSRLSHRDDDLIERPRWGWRYQVLLYLAVPVLATLGTGPLIAYYFGRLSLVGFLSNPILVPLVGFILVPLGFLVGFLCFLSSSLSGFLLVGLAGPLLSWTLAGVVFFAKLPMASIETPTPNLLELVALYAVLISLFWLRRPFYFVSILSLGLGLMALDGLHWWKERWHRTTLRVTYLSVGPGDSAVVELPGSRVLVIDAGGHSSRTADPGGRVVAPFLRSRGIYKVDYLVLSHPKVDHYGGMKSVVETFDPKEFWSALPGSGTSRYHELVETLDRMGVQKKSLSRDVPCRSAGPVRLCFLYPAKGEKGKSLVLRLSFGRYDFLFPGDIESQDEAKLLTWGTELSSQVLKIPRHGSARASTVPFLKAVNPKLAILSVGHGRAFRPDSGVLSRYRERQSTVLRTDRDGAVIVETDGKSLHYWTHRSGKKGALPS